MVSNRMIDKIDNFSIAFNEFLKAYFSSDKEPQSNHQNKSDDFIATRVNDIKVIQSFLAHPCKCGKNCQLQFTENEILKSREDYKTPFT